MTTYMHRLITETHNQHELIKKNNSYCSPKEIYYKIHSLYKHCLLSNQDAPEELTIPILSQIHRYLNFYHRPYKLKHSIKAGQKPIHFVLNKLSEHSQYLISLRDHLISKYNSGSYSSPKEFSVGVHQKHYTSIAPFLNEELNRLLYNYDWLPRNSAIIRSAAFKMHAKDLHHSGAEKYHLDNDPECIKAIIFPFDRDEDDGCFTYRSMNQSNSEYFRLILPHLQRNKKYSISNESSFLSSDQYDLYKLVSHSRAFQASNIIDLMANSERIARHEMYSGVIFKGDTTFHKGGGVVSTPRFSIQILLDIKSHG